MLTLLCYVLGSSWQCKLWRFELPIIGAFYFEILNYFSTFDLLCTSKINDRSITAYHWQQYIQIGFLRNWDKNPLRTIVCSNRKGGTDLMRIIAGNMLIMYGNNTNTVNIPDIETRCLTSNYNAAIIRYVQYFKIIISFGTEYGFGRCEILPVPVPSVQMKLKFSRHWILIFLSVNVLKKTSEKKFNHDPRVTLQKLKTLVK